MDPSTPISHLQSKPRLLLETTRPMEEEEDTIGIPNYKCNSPINPTPPPSKRRSPPMISTYSPERPVTTMKELLLLSPSPPYRKPRPRPIALVVDEPAADVSVTPRRRAGKSRAPGVSPRNVRRARRRLEKDIAFKEENENININNNVPPLLQNDDDDDDANDNDNERGAIRKRRQTKTKTKTRSHKDNSLCLVASIPSSTTTSPLLMPKIGNDNSNQSPDSKWEMFRELVMWKNVAKSTLWFGLGSMFFISSSFSTDFNFSLISTVSHLAIMILGLAFFYDSVPQTQRQLHKARGGGKFQLTEENILRAARLVLPMANAILSRSQELFSGEPLMTLKVAPILLFTANYGHLITLWRLVATGFFLSFTIPKLYSCYSEMIHNRIEETKNYVMEAWKSCPRKNMVAASTTMVLWNLFSVKMRISAVFISVVFLRYHRRHHIYPK